MYRAFEGRREKEYPVGVEQVYKVVIEIGSLIFVSHHHKVNAFPCRYSQGGQDGGRRSGKAGAIYFPAGSVEQGHELDARGMCLVPVK